MKVVASNTDQEIAATRAREAIRWPLRQLAANMIRTVRGAGKPARLGGEMVAVLSAFEEYREVVGYYPSADEISDALSIVERRPDADRATLVAWDDAIQTIIRGALQISASRLARQNTQEAAGQSELTTGVQYLEGANAGLRAEHLPSKEATREALKKLKATANKTKRKPPPRH